MEKSSMYELGSPRRAERGSDRSKFEKCLKRQSSFCSTDILTGVHIYLHFSNDGAC